MVEDLIFVCFRPALSILEMNHASAMNIWCLFTCIMVNYNWVQDPGSHYSLSILILLNLFLGPPNSNFPSGFKIKMLYASFQCAVCSEYSILDLITTDI